MIGEGQHEKLYDTFNMQGYSDYVVVYLRLITSGQLQKDAEFYKHFIEGDRTVVEFCHQVKLIILIFFIYVEIIMKLLFRKLSQCLRKVIIFI